MNYVGYAWLANMTYAFGSIVGKLATKHHIANPWYFNIVWYLLTILFILPFAVSNNVGVPTHWESILWYGLANAVSGTLFTHAFYAVDVSVLSPLANLRTPLTVLVGILFFKEHITTVQYIYIALICLGGIFVQYNENEKLRAFVSKQSLIAIAWVLSSVWFGAMIKYASAFNGFWEVSLWSNIVGFLFCLPTIPLWIRDVRTTPVRHYWGLMLSTMLFTAGLLFEIKALAVHVGIATAIMSIPISMFIAILLSKIAPKLLEKHSAKVYAIRLISATVMVLSALGLST